MQPLSFPTNVRSALILGHHDADGVTCSALAGAFLRSCYPRARMFCGTVDFHLQDRWQEMWTRLGEREFSWGVSEPTDLLALMDFPATRVPAHIHLFYADHHLSAFRSCGATADLEQEYMRRALRGEPIFYDPTVASCTHLLKTSLLQRCGWSPPSSLGEAIELAHRIDQADYPTVRDAVDYEGSRMARFDALIPSLSEREAALSAQLLSEGADLDTALFRLHFAKTEQLILNSRRVLSLVDEIVSPVGNYAALIDWSHPAVWGTRPVRFAEYANPSIRYGIRLEVEPQPGGCLARVTLSRSPWVDALSKELADPHFGKIAEMYGGGGHSFAAGFRVRATSLESLRSQVWGLVHDMQPLLQPLDSSHPLSEQSA